MDNYVDSLTKEFDRINAKCKIVSASHVKELFEEIDRLNHTKKISTKI